MKLILPTVTILLLILLLILFYIFWYFKTVEKSYFTGSKTSKKFDVDLSLQDPEYFKDKKLIICGLARDIENRISYFRENLKRIIPLFQDHLIVLVENDSVDNTRKVLLDMKPDFNLVLLGCGIDSSECVMNTKKYGKDHSSNRIEKMVKIRNIYMDYLNRLSPGEYDLVLMYDIDLVCNVYQDGLLNTAYYFNKFPEIDMIASNSVYLTPFATMLGFYEYYDTYAMIPQKKYIKYDNKTLGEKTDLMEVESAFGGFAIYRFGGIHGFRYSYEEDSRKQPICEHVVFNRNINNKFINPRMILPITKN
jgi:hypothetical protein